VCGRAIGGFAAIAWPAKYGSSGVMSSIVNQDGKVFRADSGPGTAAKAARCASIRCWPVAGAGEVTLFRGVRRAAEDRDDGPALSDSQNHIKKDLHHVQVSGSHRLAAAVAVAGTGVARQMSGRSRPARAASPKSSS
jgi:hypothetical protein